MRPIRTNLRDAALIRGFIRDDRGSLTILTIFFLLSMLVIGGLGIDLMQNETHRIRLQATLDRAVLAAADLDQTQDPQEVVNDYFQKAGLGEALTGVEVSQGLNYRTVSAEGRQEVETIFLHMLGVDRMLSPAAGAATESRPNVEVSLALDISGSMRFDGRMDALRPAARDFIDQLLSGEAGATTSVNLIPYAGATNPGPTMFDYLEGERLGGSGGSGGDYFPDWGQDISNVVAYFDRDGDGAIDRVVKVDGFPDGSSSQHISNDMDDFFGALVDYAVENDPELEAGATVIGASIKGGRVPTAFYAVAGDTNGTYPDSGPTMNNGKGPDVELPYVKFDANGQLQTASSCLEIDGPDFQARGLPTGRQQVPHFMYWNIAASVMDWGWCPEDDTAIRYLSNDPAALGDVIDQMRMHDGTGTHYAMKWALALLDPASNDAIRHLADAGEVSWTFADRPAAWEDEEARKYIVLMTDGQITSQHRPVDPLAPENATTELKRQPSEKRQQITSASQNVDSFYAQCAAAKEKNVVIFTIAFNAPAAAREQMQDCASSPAHFFAVEDLQIDRAFDRIAMQINELRLIR